MRACEWIVALFFSWATVLAFVFGVPGPIRLRIVCVDAGILVLYVALLRIRTQAWVGYARDWIPQALGFLAYKEMGWFAPAMRRGSLEQQWVVWDRLVLNDLGGRAALEAAGVVLPMLMELSYSLVYTIPPLSMIVLYLPGLRNRANTFLTVYLLGLFLSYGQFPFWPSEPPRTVFAGEDLPRVHTFFRDFNLWLVGSYGIHTSVFPSAHVSGVFAAALAMKQIIPRRTAIVLVYCVYAVLVALATVYGRYHFAADAVAGLIAGVVALPLGVLLVSAVSRRNSRGSIDRESH